MTNEEIKNKIKIDEQISILVNRDILCSVNITMEQELKNNPELLNECKNYKEDEETGEYPDIMEYYAVSDNLGEDLKKQGEIVFECLDFIVWGRQTTGQAVAMDYVIKKIAKINERLI